MLPSPSTINISAANASFIVNAEPVFNVTSPVTSSVLFNTVVPVTSRLCKVVSAVVTSNVPVTITSSSNVVVPSALSIVRLPKAVSISFESVIPTWTLPEVLPPVTSISVTYNFAQRPFAVPAPNSCVPFCGIIFVLTTPLTETVSAESDPKVTEPSTVTLPVTFALLSTCTLSKVASPLVVIVVKVVLPVTSKAPEIFVSGIMLIVFAAVVVSNIIKSVFVSSFTDSASARFVGIIISFVLSAPLNSISCDTKSFCHALVELPSV